MSYDLGKKVALGGFAGMFLMQLISFAISILDIGIGARLLNIVGSVFILAAVGGFAIMWFDKRNILDLVIAGGILISLNSGFISSGSIFGAIILGVISNAYLIVWAFKAKDSNTIVAALLACAFLLKAGSIIVSTIYYKIFDTSIFYVILYLGVSAIPVYAAFSEGN